MGAAALPTLVGEGPARRALAAALEGVCGEVALAAVGEPVQGGGRAYHGGAFGNDGLLYLIPQCIARRALQPRRRLAHAIGDDLGEGRKWAGGVLCDDGCIYALPRKASRALRIDPAKGTAAPLATTSPSGNAASAGTAPSPGQTACCTASHESTAVLCFDPATGKASAFGELPTGGTSTCGVPGLRRLHLRGTVHAKRALRIDPVARTATMIGDELDAKVGAGYPARSAPMAASTSRHERPPACCASTRRRRRSS